MLFIKYVALIVIALSSPVHAGSMPIGAWPQSTGGVTSTKPIVVKAGTVFDGRLQTFARKDVTCSGHKETGSKDAVFLVEAGATLRNVIIGKNQAGGVHCEKSGCTIENVWWDDVCKDALSVKGGSASSVTRVIDCGARFAKDEIIQHIGAGTVIIDGFYAQDFGKLYRSCGSCGAMPRTVQVSNVLAVNPKVSIVTVNVNYADRATLRNVKIRSSSANVTICGKAKGGNGNNSANLGSGPDGKVCIYNTTDIYIAEGSSRAAAAPSATSAVPTPPQSDTPTPSTMASSASARPAAPIGGVGPGNVKPDSRINQPLPVSSTSS